MAYKPTNLIAEAFRTRQLKYRLLEVNNASAIETGFRVENASDILVRFISSSDKNDVAMRIQLMNVSEDKTVNMVMALNECNEKYRFCKFVLNQNQDVFICYDFPMEISDECLGNAAFEIFARLTRIMKDVYPILMKALWA